MFNPYSQPIHVTRIIQPSMVDRFIQWFVFGVLFRSGWISQCRRFRDLKMPCGLSWLAISLPGRRRSLSIHFPLSVICWSSSAALPKWSLLQRFHSDQPWHSYDLRLQGLRICWKVHRIDGIQAQESTSILEGWKFGNDIFFPCCNFRKVFLTSVFSTSG